MTAPSPHEQTNLPTTGETAIEMLPFGLRWLQAVDPRTFSGRTWESGGSGHVRIFLSPPEGLNGGARVERYITRYLDGGTQLSDEVHFPRDFDQVSQLRYEFNAEGELTDYPTNTPNEHLSHLIDEMSGLVDTAGSTITASSREFGLESSFVSDGTQWIDQNTATPIVHVQP